AETATLPLRHRKALSTTSVLRNVESTFGGIAGAPLIGRIMFKWFSITTAPCSERNLRGSSVAIRRRFCSFAVVRCSNKQGFLVISQSSPSSGLKYGSWFLLSALKTNEPF